MAVTICDNFRPALIDWIGQYKAQFWFEFREAYIGLVSLIFD